MEGTAVAVYSANCYPFRLSLNASDGSLLTTIPESIFRTDSGVGTDGPVNYSGSYTSVRNTIGIERRLKNER